MRVLWFVCSLFFSLSAAALENKDVVGKWTLDEAASKGAADGNTAGLMKELTIKEDGTFEAMYGTKGSWKIMGGKLTVSYENDYKKDRPGSGDAKLLKFPAPAMHEKFCYMTRVGDAATTAAAAPAAGGAATTAAVAPAANAPAAGGGAPGGSFVVGDKVQVEWKGSWYAASVLAVKDGKYQIHYNDFDSSWDEWVGTDRMKR
jgi:hypothetical protein